jgi:putative NADPH-quinone reductase/1,4-dihydroxy-2-naphthoate octaprenyltransferase
VSDGAPGPPGRLDGALKVLVIAAHPRAGSFCESLADAYAHGAREAGCVVRRLSLAELDFDPDVRGVSPLQQPLEPDLAAALGELEWAAHWVFVYPAWWGFAPARMKGLLDRILLPGRAFRETDDGRIEGLMHGRTAHLLTTLDMPPWVYRWIYRAAGQQALRRSVLGVCGIRCTRAVAFGPVNHSDAAQRSSWQRRAEQLGRSLAAGPMPLPQRIAGTLGAWLRALRLQFFPMSWLAYTVGALAAANSAAWDRSAYWFGYASLFFVKAATVFSNERHDFESDRINRNAGAFNGGSRVLVDGSIDASRLRQATLLVLSCAGVFAVLALAHAGGVAAALVLGISTLAALGYTVPPLRLSWRGWGEIDVALTHSIGVILWGYVLQGGSWRDAAPWLLSLPLGLSILPAILLSSVPDLDADRQAGKRTLAVRHGPRVAIGLAAAAALAALAAAVFSERIADAGFGYAPLLPWIVLHLLVLLGLLQACRKSTRRLSAAIVCALAYILWFVAAPLWQLTGHR